MLRRQRWFGFIRRVGNTISNRARISPTNTLARCHAGAAPVRSRAWRLHTLVLVLALIGCVLWAVAAGSFRSGWADTEAAIAAERDTGQSFCGGRYPEPTAKARCGPVSGAIRHLPEHRHRHPYPDRAAALCRGRDMAVVDPSDPRQTVKTSHAKRHSCPRPRNHRTRKPPAIAQPTAPSRRALGSGC